jgi:hypothetical protein
MDETPAVIACPAAEPTATPAAVVATVRVKQEKRCVSENALPSHLIFTVVVKKNLYTYFEQKDRVAEGLGELWLMGREQLESWHAVEEQEGLGAGRVVDEQAQCVPDGSAGFEEQEHEQVRIVESGCTAIVNGMESNGGVTSIHGSYLARHLEVEGKNKRWRMQALGVPEMSQ